MSVFDGQFHARRVCGYFSQRQLSDMMKLRDDPIVNQPASAVAAAGGHRALIALLHATAPDRTDRERRRLQDKWVPLRGFAAATLTMLARVDELRPQLVAAGAVQVLVDMLDEEQPFAFSEVPFSVTALLGVLPVELTSASFDGPWVRSGGQPLSLGEVAATALAALTGRACLFKMPCGVGGAGAGGSGAWAELPLAEYFIAQVSQRLSTFGTGSVGEMVAASGGAHTELTAAFVAETRDTNVAVIDMLTQDYKTARAIVSAGAVLPLVELVRARDSDAARSCLRSVSVSPDVELMIRDAGGETGGFSEGQGFGMGDDDSPDGGDGDSRRKGRRGGPRGGPPDEGDGDGEGGGDAAGGRRRTSRPAR